MYRFVIEHPRWISPNRLAMLDPRAGADKGRIYRLVPEGRPLRAVPRLDTLATRDLAAALDSPNGTLRDNVQRLLVDRLDLGAAPILESLARTSTRPDVRAQAICTLQGMGVLEPSLLLHSLRDAHPGVRRQAVRLSEPWLGKDVALGRALIALADDPEVTVRYQLALSLGEWTAPDAGRALGQIAVKDGTDAWVRAAVLSSSVPHAASVLEHVVRSAGAGDISSAIIEPLIATLTATNDRRAITRALAVVGGPDVGEAAKPVLWRLGAAAELLDSSRDQTLVEEPAVKALIASARKLAVDPATPPDSRLVALRLLGRVPADRSADRELIARQLDPTESVEVQLAAVQALARLEDRPSAEAVVTRGQDWDRPSAPALLTQ